MPLIDPFDTQAVNQDPQAAPQSAQGGLIDPFDAPQSAANDAKNSVASAPQKEEVGGGWLNKIAPFLPEPLGAAAMVGQVGQDVVKDPTEAERQQEAQQAGVPAAPQATPFGTQVLSEFTDQPHSKMVAYAKSRFPDMPLDKALQRYGVINNHIVFVGQDGHVYAEDKPGTGATLIGNSPTIAGNVLGGIVGGTLGGAATLTVGGVGSIPGAIVGAGIGAGAGSAARDVIANHLGIEQDKGAGDIALSAGGNAILGSAFEGGGQLIGRGLLPAAGKGIGYLANKGQDFYDGIVAKAKGIPHESVNPDSAFNGVEAQETKQAADTLGLPLSKAETTMAKGDLDQERTLRGLPGSSDKFNEADQIRNPKIRQAVTDFMDNIAPSSAVPTAAADVRAAAKGAINTAENDRAAAAQPHYDASNPQTISQESYDTLMKNPVIEDTWKKIQSDTVYKGALDGVAPNSGQALHAIKTSLDDQIGAASRAGEKFRASQLINTKNNLLNTLEEQVPEYNVARQTFRDNSGPVNQLQNSIIGKVADTKDTQLKTVARTLFDPAESDPKVLQQAMNAIKQQNPDAWNAILRNHIQSQFENMKVSTQNGASFGKAFANQFMGTEKKREMLSMALRDNPEALENFKLLMRVMPRLGAAGDVGSPTATRQVFLEKYKDNLGGAVVGALGGYAAGGKEGSVSGAGLGLLTGKLAVNQWAKVWSQMQKDKFAGIAEALLNPKYTQEMRAIRKMDPGTKQAAAALTTLLTRIGQENASKGFEYTPNQSIPMQQQQQTQ